MTETTSRSKNTLLNPAEIKVTPPNATTAATHKQELRQPPLNNSPNSNTPSSTTSALIYNSGISSSTSRRGSAIPSGSNNTSGGLSSTSTSPSRIRSNSANINDLTPTPSHHQPAHAVTRQRRSSSLIQHLEPDTLDTKIDQALNPNVNANWVHQKGAWIIHIVIIILLKIFYNFINVLDNDWKWTLTNLTYTIGSYIMFHQVKGTPFEFNSGAYDNLTMWEQIDNGDQYTPTKKFLMLVPICLFLISTHYSHYDLNLFILNGVSCLCVVIPKLAIAHRLRVTLY
ncbi:ORM1 [Candida pseudojiufengensis]|uniref:ORM1 n=1 Tax=Candida pseudojiufengensis TaxID=497109 RepID=UPI0022256246|nr:ORM1 [Candida pseudojiufengensis]KAI5963220.1 ORM1 [Candida pseudojiufengensis]